MDDITPLRYLTSETLEQEAALVQTKPSMQRGQGVGGWPEGDATFFGAPRDGDAFITYYQRSRHLFGDLKIEILDADGRVLEQMAGSARRGLNRATWSMRVAPPRVPPAATIAGAATIGPRVLPGNYTVRLTKGKQTYTTTLVVAPDPRAEYSVEDRRKNFDAAMRVHALFGDMTTLVERINAVRARLAGLARNAAAGSKARTDLAKLEAEADELRKKVVATREGGAITGEERLRERVADLYGSLVFYEGAPTDDQLRAIGTLTGELADVRTEFDAFEKKLPAARR
jgi:hypothetical protein